MITKNDVEELRKVVMSQMVAINMLLGVQQLYYAWLVLDHVLANASQRLFATPSLCQRKCSLGDKTSDGQSDEIHDRVMQDSRGPEHQWRFPKAARATRWHGPKAVPFSRTHSDFGVQQSKYLGGCEQLEPHVVRAALTILSLAVDLKGMVAL